MSDVKMDSYCTRTQALVGKDTHLRLSEVFLWGKNCTNPEALVPSPAVPCTLHLETLVAMRLKTGRNSNHWQSADQQRVECMP